MSAARFDEEAAEAFTREWQRYRQTLLERFEERVDYLEELVEVLEARVDGTPAAQASPVLRFRRKTGEGGF